ncbi:MAG: archaellum operon transcriptional activator EarA family protein [Candidatus Bathyarchaeia archaeon]
MVKKRSKMELYLEVLRTISRGVNKPTNIMYKCNLSWMNSREILNSLVEQNLVTVIENNNRRIYRITERGRKVLEYFENAPNIFLIYRRRRGSSSLK